MAAHMTHATNPYLSPHTHTTLCHVCTYSCILLELSVGHDLFCEKWMVAYDYELMQDPPTFQVLADPQYGGGDRCRVAAIDERRDCVSVCASPSTPIKSIDVCYIQPQPFSSNPIHMHVHKQARLHECRAAIERVMRESLQLNPTLVDFTLGLLAIDPTQR